MKKIILSLTLMCFMFTSYGQLKLSQDGYVGIGDLFFGGGVNPFTQFHVAGGATGNTALFTGVNVGIGTLSPARPLEVVGQIMSSNSDTYPTSKQSNFLMRHYDNQTTHFSYFNAQSDAVNNQVIFGGGAGSQYSATVLAFYTGTTNETALGSEAMRVNNNGLVRIRASGTMSHMLNVNGDASKPGGGEWATLSDKRFKHDVNEYKEGLEVIMQIEPKTFKYTKDSGYDERAEYVGIIAQDMEKIAPYTVKEVEYKLDEDNPRSEMGSMLTFDGTAIKYMLINAIQEQQETIQDLTSELEDKDAQIEALEDRMTQMEAMVNSIVTVADDINITEVTFDGEATIQQNKPNPFNEQTTINYNVPVTAKNAYMQIFDINGQLLKSVRLDNGQGQLMLKAGELSASTYSYSLIIDGKLVDTKQMVLTK